MKQWLRYNWPFIAALMLFAMFVTAATLDAYAHRNDVCVHHDTRTTVTVVNNVPTVHTYTTCLEWRPKAEVPRDGR